MSVSKEVFAERLRNLIEEEGVSQKQLAAETGIAESSISKYLSCIAEPKLIPIVNIARYFDVSVDYLLGISNCKQYEENMQAASKVTGLGDDALLSLNKMEEEERNVLNLILCSTLFKDVISYINEYSKIDGYHLTEKKVLARCEELAQNKQSKDSKLAQAYIKYLNYIRRGETNKKTVRDSEQRDKDKKTLLLFSVTNAVTDMTKMCNEPLVKMETTPEKIELATRAVLKEQQWREDRVERGRKGQEMSRNRAKNQIEEKEEG